jgi:protein required for attachment to host cells
MRPPLAGPIVTLVAGEGGVMRQRKVCFVIADGGHARFVKPANDYALHTVEAVDSTTVHKRDHDLVSDRPGRAFESGSSARHAYTPRHDPRDLAKDRFTQAVARKVNEESAADMFNELVVVAPSHVLQELTDALDQAAHAKLIGRLPRDLVKTPDDALWPHLKEWVRPVHRA